MHLSRKAPTEMFAAPLMRNAMKVEAGTKLVLFSGRVTAEAEPSVKPEQKTKTGSRATKKPRTT
jgi:hypothetical protein